MKQISSIELSFLLSDLKSLEGSKIDKIYNKGTKVLVFQLYSQKAPKKLLKITDNNIIYLDNEKTIYDKPSSFCQILRRELIGFKIEKIIQIGSQRVIEVLFSLKNVKKLLIFEIFSKGNIILCDDKYKVLLAAFYHKWKDREIRINQIYKFPEQEINIFDLKNENFKEIITKSSKKSIVTSLALDLSIGGLYSEEICLRANIDKSIPPQNISSNEINKVYNIFNKIIRAKNCPNVVYKDNQLLDVIPIELSLYKGLVKKQFKNFSEALAYYIKNTNKETSNDPKIEAERNRLLKIIRKQKEKIREMEKSEQEMRKIAEKIYENYQPILKILSDIDFYLKNKNLKDFKTTLNKYKTIKSFDPKEKTITIEL